MDAARVDDPPSVLGRYLAVDERGTGLRATWRPAHGFVNVSLWRDDTCVEVFHLAPIEVGRLIAFLANGLAAAAPRSARGLRSPSGLRSVDQGGDHQGQPGQRPSWLDRLPSGLRSDVARALRFVAARLDDRDS